MSVPYSRWPGVALFPFLLIIPNKIKLLINEYLSKFAIFKAMRMIKSIRLHKSMENILFYCEFHYG